MRNLVSERRRKHEARSRVDEALAKLPGHSNDNALFVGFAAWSGVGFISCAAIGFALGVLWGLVLR